MFFVVMVFSGICFAQKVSDSNSPVPEYIQSVGGSNFCMYKITDDYLVREQAGSWWKPGVLNHAVAAFHLQEPGYIKQTLSLMYENGQRKIALVIWHIHFKEKEIKNSETAEIPGYENIYGHTLNSAGGSLCDQHKKNLIQLLRLIQQIDFESVTIRFASQARSCVTSWKKWEEEYYQENLRFILSTKQIADTVLENKVPLFYDLGLELGGLDSQLCSQYTARLWKEYTDMFGTSDTIGFSFAVAPGRLSRMLEIYKKSGVYPTAYPLDIYSNADKVLKYIAEEFTNAGLSNPDIIIQETFYNDAKTLKEVQAAAKDHNLNILYIMQWPIERQKLYRTDSNGKKTPRHFSVSRPIEYNNYLN
jgi:hypothetical protein